MNDQIPPLRRIGGGPYQHKRLRRWSYAFELGDDKHARARLAFVEPVTEMARHRLAIMGYKNAVLLCRELEHGRIGKASYTCLRGGRESHRWFNGSNCQDDVMVQISVGLKADQDCRSLIWARARCSLSQRAGFVWANGMLFASNSRLASSRYASMWA